MSVHGLISLILYFMVRFPLHSFYSFEDLKNTALGTSRRARPQRYTLMSRRPLRPHGDAESVIEYFMSHAISLAEQ